MKNTEEQSTPRTQEECDAIMTELDKRARNLSDFCEKNHLPLFMATGVMNDEKVSCLSIIMGKPIEVGEMIGKTLKESKAVQTVVIATLLEEKLKHFAKDTSVN